MHLILLACYYYYLQALIVTDALDYDRKHQNRTQLSSRPNVPGALNSPSTLCPKDGTVSSLLKENAGNAIFSHVGLKSRMKGNGPSKQLQS